MSSELSFGAVNAAILEKIALSQRVAVYLNDEPTPDKRLAIENVARLLAQDISQQVREALAFELRNCKCLPHDLAARIASDVESVASSFLAATEAFTDQQLAGLIPHLEEHAHITLARRKGLGQQSCMAIVSVGDESPVRCLLENNTVKLQAEACGKIINRFATNQSLMDLLAQRIELPINLVEDIIDKVSGRYRVMLTDRYNIDVPMAEEIALKTKYAAIWRQVEKANPAQIHAYVFDLRNEKRLTEDMTLEFVARGCFNFLTSVIALDAELTLSEVRQGLFGGDMHEYVAVMQKAGVSKATAHEYLRIIKGFPSQRVH